MIKIGQRFRPFTHVVGSECLIPLSTWSVQAYPTMIRLKGPNQTHEIKLEHTGPVKNFTLLQDLEKNCVQVFGKGKEGHFIYTITHRNKTISVVNKKKEKNDFPIEETAMEPPVIERLALGVHKKTSLGKSVSQNESLRNSPCPLFLRAKNPDRNARLSDVGRV